MQKAISLILALGLTFGIAGPAMGESRLVSPGGISQGTADGLYGSLAGESAWAGTQSFALATLIAKAATADTHVATRVFGDGRWAQLAAASNTFTGVQLLPDGTSSDPPLAFASESGTGLFLTKAGRMALAIEGTGSIITFDATNMVIDTNLDMVGSLTVGGSTTLGDTNADNLTIWPDEILFSSTGDTHFNFTTDALFDGATIIRFAPSNSVQIASEFEIEGTTGIDLAIGAGVDADILTLGISGAPGLGWVTASTSWNLKNPLRVPSLGIGVMPLTPTAAFQISSTTQGTIPVPPMTSAQRDAIGSPPESLWVYDLTNNVPNYYNGTGWRAVLNIAASSLTLGCIPFADSAHSLIDDAGLAWDNIDKILAAKNVTLDGGLLDANGNKILIPVGVDTAFNEFTITNAASDNDPEISATGVDDNIGIKLTPKGTGGIALGSGAPSIRMKKVTGVTGASEGDTTNIAHGVTLSKILGCDVLVARAGGGFIPPAYTRVTESEYFFIIDSANVKVELSATNSNSITEDAITVLLTYEE